MFELHTAHCERFLYRCTECGEVLPKTQQQKHEQELHTKVKCPYCEEMLTKDNIQAHKTRCDFKPKPCQFCTVEMPLVSLIEHEEDCGNRTEECTDCKKFVRVKDFPRHIAYDCKGQIEEVKTNEKKITVKNPKKKPEPENESSSSEEEYEEPVPHKGRKRKLPARATRSSKRFKKNGK